MSYYFLKKDFDALEKKIDETKTELKKLGQEISDSCDQTSETWHDNFTFEEAARNQKMIMRELEELYQLRNHATVVDKNDKPSHEVSIGKKVKIKNVLTGEIKNFLVGSYMVLDKIDLNEISYKTPIMKKITGHTIGEIIEIEIGGQKTVYFILEVIC